ncbi:MAG: adenylate/guanylate cyclase domain-containing protein [Proteobacteria bacterium]|nr:adenylate/guanylate cyclase domain-containing protein [Pseudomonadota bacterium]
MAKAHQNLRRLGYVLLPTLALSLLPIWLFDAEPSSLLSAEILNTPKGPLETIESVQAAAESAWQTPSPATNSFNSGWQQIYWTRIRLPPLGALGGADRLIAESRFIPFTNLEFFLVDQGKPIKHHLTGRDHPEDRGFTLSPFYDFEAPLGPTPRILYIRSDAASANFPRILMKTPEAFKQQNARRITLMGILTGMTVGLLLYNLALLVVLRNRSTALMLMIQLAYFASVYLFLGYDRIAPPAIDLHVEPWIRLALTLSTIAPSLIVYLVWSEIRLDRSSTKLVKINRRVQIAFMMVIAIAWTAPMSIAPILVPFAVSALITRIMIAQYRYLHLDAVTWMFAAHAGALISVLISAIDVFDLFISSDYTRYAAHIGLIFLGVTYAASSAIKLRAMRTRQDKITRVLQEDRAKTELNSLLSSVYEEREATVQADVSIMFVDIVQFSVVSDLRPAAEVYTELAKKMRDMITIIERHGGSVDRSLGDGILCFFGYSEASSGESHTTAALRAGEEIQRLYVRTSSDEEPASETLILPVRIGIHSSRVVIGNLGDSKHMDYTMIGSGVNFASRLETACSPFKIMLSQATMSQLLTDGFSRELFTPVSVAIKHQRGLTLAYEYDPFSLARNELSRIEAEFLNQLGLRRKDMRRTLDRGTKIFLDSDLGQFEVLDFSIHGFKAVGPTLIGRQAVVMVRIVTTNEAVNQALRNKLLQGVMVVVRWSQQYGGRFIHGFKIHGNSEERKQFLYEQLSMNLAHSSADLDPVETTEVVA